MVCNSDIGANMDSKMSGTSLIELLVVVAIVLMVATIGITQGRRCFEYLRLETCAREIVSILRLLQCQAVSEERTLLLKFVGADFQWGYLIRKTDDEGFLVDEQTYRSLPFGIKIDHFSQPSKEIYFYPSAAPSAGVTIGLTNKDTQAISITIVPATGRIQLKERGF